jgi:hypothetical protein
MNLMASLAFIPAKIASHTALQPGTELLSELEVIEVAGV